MFFLSWDSPRCSLDVPRFARIMMGLFMGFAIFSGEIRCLKFSTQETNLVGAPKFSWVPTIFKTYRTSQKADEIGLVGV